MAKRKTAKYSILVTVLCLVLCGAMVLGGTYAWFSDSAESKDNIIAAGKLDVEMTYYDDDADAWKDASEGAIFNYNLWEPGYTTVKYIKVANAGTLDFKFNLQLVPGAETSKTDNSDPNNPIEYKLSNVIDVYFGENVKVNTRNDLFNLKYVGTLAELMADPDGAAYGVMLDGESKEYCIALKMQESAGNEYQNLSISDISVKLYAEQYTSEQDSFGSDYDNNAGLPVAMVYRASQYENTSIPWGSYGSWSPSNTDQTMEAAYTFTAADTAETVADSPYKAWNCDYYVSVDKDIQAGQVFLGGYYAAFNAWVGFENPVDVVAGEFIPLLGSVGETWTYENIVNGVGEFVCGVADIDDELTGTTFTVQLRLTNPVDATESYVISEVKYTFKKTVTKTDIAAALASGGEIALAEDISLTDSPLTISADTVIDLNGHTLSGVATNSSTSNLIKVSNGKSLTLKNGTVSFGATTPDTNWGGEGQPAYPGYASNTIRNEGELIIDGAVIENKTGAGGASYAIDNYNGAELTVKSGRVIQSGGDVAIRMFGGTTNVTIKGGEISGKRAVWIHVPGSDSSKAPDMNLTITGGTLTGSQMAIYSYSYGNSFADVDVKISGGTFNGDVCFGGGYKGDQENVTVTGGTFNGELGRYLANDGWDDIAKP